MGAICKPKTRCNLSGKPFYQKKLNASIISQIMFQQERIIGRRGHLNPLVEICENECEYYG